MTRFNTSSGDFGKKLEPCPFCGCEAKFRGYAAYRGGDWRENVKMQITCTGCKIVTATVQSNDAVDRLAEFWNKRTSGKQNLSLVPPVVNFKEL